MYLIRKKENSAKERNKTLYATAQHSQGILFRKRKKGCV
nr:MAG TPA: hypothetical protein [Caudoviricetes sp.]